MTESEWLASVEPAAMLTALMPTRSGDASPIQHEGGRGGISDRRLRLFACACCRQAWHLLTDERSRAAVEVAERYADGRAPESEREEAEQEALAAERAGTDGGENLLVARREAIACVTSAAVHAAQTVGRAMHLFPPAQKAALLRCVAGNPFRPVTVVHKTATVCPRCERETVTLYHREGDSWHCTHCRLNCHPKRRERTPWLTPTVLAIARAAYDSREWDRLPILADALEDASCDNEDILTHLRGREVCPKCIGEGRYRIYPRDQLVGSPPVYSTCWGCKMTTDRQKDGVLLGCGFIDLRGPHVRGDWAVDLILGLE